MKETLVVALSKRSQVAPSSRSVSLRSLAREYPWAKDDEDVQKAITYFANQSRAGRMDYPPLVESKIPIGSGVTEAACQVLVKQRLYGSGMRWKGPGAAAVLSVRCLRYTTGRWSQFWAQNRPVWVPGGGLRLHASEVTPYARCVTRVPPRLLRKYALRDLTSGLGPWGGQGSLRSLFRA